MPPTRRSSTPTGFLPSKRPRPLSTIEELCCYLTETPEQRTLRADKYAEWVERKPGVMQSMDSGVCRCCDKDITTEDKTFRLKGTAALVICEDCIHISAERTTKLDYAIQDSFEMARRLGPQIRRFLSSK
jgi:hypothetical protein